MNMLTINKILCPTDFSDPSYVGLKAANDLAVHFSAELLVVHVVTPLHFYPPVPTGGVGVNNPLYVEEMVQASEKTMSEAVKNTISSDLEVRSTVLEGNPADQIVDLAESENVDMIVIATHGSTGWRRLISGSVTERVVRQAGCPVFTVPAPQVETEEK
jgi:nucleotide-binding universal stress UspA family protein